MDGDSLVIGHRNFGQSGTWLRRTSIDSDIALLVDNPGGSAILGIGVQRPEYNYGYWSVAGINMTGPGLAVWGRNYGTGDGVVGAATAADASGVFGENDNGGFGVRAYAQGPRAAVFADNSGSGNAVEGRSGSANASGVYGENNAGGFGVAGRTAGPQSAVLGDNTGSGNGVEGLSRDAPGVFGFSRNSYGGVFIGPTGEATPVNSGGIRVVGVIVKTGGEYAEALPHPDGSQRLMYAPLSPESWYEDFGRGEMAEGRAHVELDPDFVALLGIEDDDYHVFLTPEGDSNGLFVTDKGPRGFEVHEQRGGTAKLTFSYRVVAKRRHRQPERLATLDEPEGLFASAR